MRSLLTSCILSTTLAIGWDGTSWARSWSIPGWPSKVLVNHESLSPASMPTFPADVDGDGNDEYVMVIYDQNMFQIMDDNNRTWLHSCRVKGLRGIQTINIDNDGRDDIWFSTVRDSIFRLYIIPGREIDGRDTATNNCDDSNHLWYSEKVPMRRAGPLQFYDVFGTLDCNGDSTPDLVVCMGSEKIANAKRGVLVIDGRTRRPLWNRVWGPWPYDRRIADVDGDGVPEIVVTGISTDNGVTLGGYADSTAYLFALRRDGQYMWPPFRLGPRFLRVMMAILPKGDSSKGKDIVVCTNSSERGAGDQAMSIIDGATGRIVRSIHRPVGFESIVIIDRATGGADVVVSTDDSLVLTYDTLLRPLDSLRTAGGNRSMLNGPFSLPPAEEIVIGVTDGSDSMVFVDGRLHIVHHEHSPQLPTTLTLARNTNPDWRKLIVSGGVANELVNVRIVPKGVEDVIPPPIALAIGSSFIIGSLIYVRQRRRYYSLLDGVFNDTDRIIIGVDPNSRVYRVNRQAERYFDELPGAIRGQDLAVLKDHQRYGPVIQIITNLLGAGVDKHEKIQVIESGFAREYLIDVRFLVKMHLGKRVRAVVLIQDVTELSQRRALELWGTISQTLAHDLKKPLAPLRLFLEDLSSRVKANQLDSLTIEKQYVTPAVSQIDYLERQLNRMGKIPNPLEQPREPVEICDFITYIVALKQPTLPKPITLELLVEDHQVWVRGFRENLERALGELIENAASALTGRSEPKIVVSCLCDTDLKQVKISVQDNGAGISPDLLPRIYEPGVTGRAGDHKGLGLFSVFMAVTQHRGTIQVHSAPGIGTSFVITLPIMNERDTNV